VIPKALLQFRTNIEQRRRRGGLRYCLNEIRFRFSCLRRGFMNTTEFFIVTLLYVVFRLIGGTIRNRLYALVRISKETTHLYTACAITLFLGGSL
jgi:hypothetical protein